MKLTKQAYQDICFNDCDKEEYQIVEDGDWISEGKCEYKEVIFWHGGKFYSVNFNRSGSHFTDYMYGHEYEDGPFDCCEVQKKEVTVTKWVGIGKKC